MNEDLILDNIGLIFLVLKRLNLYEQSEYYYDIGLLGLVKAANTFNPDKGYKFSSFAVTCIRNEILVDIRNNKKRNNDISLYEVVTNNEKEEKTLIDIIPDEYDIEEDIIKKEQIKMLHKAISKLSPDEKLLIEYYYGDKKMGQVEIAKKINKSQAQVSRKLKRVIEKLKHIIDYYEK